MIFFANKYISGQLLYGILISVFLVTKTYAQEKYEVTPDSLKNKTIEELAALVKGADVNQSITYENALKNLQKPDIHLAMLYSEIGYHFYKKEESQRSLRYLNKGLLIAKELKNDTLVCKIYLRKGNAYLQDWENQKALDAYHTVLEMAQEKGNLRKEIIAKSNISIVLRRMNQLDSALEDCKDLLGFIDNTSFKNGKNHVNVLTILSEVYLDLEKFDSVLKYADVGIRIGKSLDYKIGIADLYTKKGIVWYKRKNFDKALEFLNQAKDILNEIKVSGRSNQSINVNYFLASYFYEIKSYDKAVGYLQETIKALKENDLRKNRVIDAHMLLAKSYKEIGDGEASIYWFTKHQELQDQFQKNKDQTVNKIYDKSTQKLDEKIKTLENKSVKEEQRRNFMIGGLLAVFIGMMIVLIAYFKKQKANKIRFNDLVEKISQLEAKDRIAKNEAKDTSRTITIDDEKISEVLKGLRKIEEQEYFLRLDCNLRSIAKKVKTNATYLSKIINTYKRKSFNDYINDLRIDYVLRRLKNDKKFRSFSITSIASEIGYKSDNSFTKHFKAKTGLNPSYYIKNIEKLEEIV